jgi:uncharacterized protein
VIVCDTGPLVAAALVNDDHHHGCVELFTDLHLARRPLLAPATVVAEVGYPLGRDASVIAVAERLDVTEVATLDRRHFTVVRPRHTTALTLLP